MSLTRKMLKAMGIEDDKIDQIIDAHTETVDALKEDRDRYKAQAADYDDLKTKFADAEKKLSESAKNDWQKKYTDEHQAFEDYKAGIAKAQAEEEKTKLCRAMLLEAGVSEKYLDKVMRVYDQSGITVENGAIQNKDTAIADIKKDWSDFIAIQQTKGAKVETPPANNNGGADGSAAKKFMEERRARQYGNSQKQSEND